MNKEIAKGLRIPVTLLGVLAMFVAGPANAEHQLVMATVKSEVVGTNEILDGDYLSGIKKSMKYANAGANIRKIAARTNLCIGYAATRQYDEAIKWCDAAVEIDRRAWITKNNRAVLYYLMGDFEASAAAFAESREAGGGYFFKVATAPNEHEIDLKLAQSDSVNESVVMMVR